MTGAFGLDRPLVLLGLIPLGAFALLGLLLDRNYAPFLGPFALRYRLSRLFTWLFFGALLFALAGPRWGLRGITEYRRGLDLILALDVSRSMEVRDSGPLTRLERAALLGLDLAEGSPSFRFGAALGRGRGTLALPLTEDQAVMKAFLGSLEEAMYGGGGTNLESLVDVAASAFLDDFPSRRVIVLLSDGESLSGSLAAAAGRAAAQGAAIVAVGLGTETGGPVAGTGDPGGTISRLRREPLEEAAALTGGLYIDGNEGQAGPRLRSYLDSLAQNQEGGGRRRESRPRWRLFLVAALAFLGLSKLCLRKSRNPGPLALALLPLALLGQSCTAGKLLVVEGNFYYAQGRYDEAVSAYIRAREDQEALPYAEYGLGTVYIALEETGAALDRYAAAARALEEFPPESRRELGYRIPYNRGLALFWEGDFEGAAAAFREALEADGSRLEAKRNLELALLSLSREQERKNLGQGEGAERERLNALFRYLDLKEQERWKSREWGEPPSAGPDY
jgi:Ca-activated chloride channel family protein